MIDLKTLGIDGYTSDDLTELGRKYEPSGYKPEHGLRAVADLGLRMTRGTRPFVERDGVTQPDVTFKDDDGRSYTAMETLGLLSLAGSANEYANATPFTTAQHMATMFASRMIANAYRQLQQGEEITELGQVIKLVTTLLPKSVTRLSVNHSASDGFVQALLARKLDDDDLTRAILDA